MRVVIDKLKGLMSLRVRWPGAWGTPAQEEGTRALEVRAGSLDFPLHTPGTYSSVNVFFLIDIVTEILIWYSEVSLFYLGRHLAFMLTFSDHWGHWFSFSEFLGISLLPTSWHGSEILHCEHYDLPVWVMSSAVSCFIGVHGLFLSTKVVYFTVCLTFSKHCHYPTFV